MKQKKQLLALLIVTLCYSFYWIYDNGRKISTIIRWIASDFTTNYSYTWDRVIIIFTMFSVSVVVAICSLIAAIKVGKAIKAEKIEDKKEP